MTRTLRLTEDDLLAIKKRLDPWYKAHPEFKRGPTVPVFPVIPKGSNKVEGSRLETMFALQRRALALPAWEEQYVGAVPGRKYRLDFAWPERKIAVECQGMVHRIKAQFNRDTEKICLLTLAGWRVLPVSGNDVRSGRAVGWLSKLLEKP